MLIMRYGCAYAIHARDDDVDAMLLYVMLYVDAMFFAALRCLRAMPRRDAPLCALYDVAGPPRRHDAHATPVIFSLYAMLTAALCASRHHHDMLPRARMPIYAMHACCACAPPLAQWMMPRIR